MDYLLKTEPTVYSFADLQRDKQTIWDGVTNPVAVRHLREMKPGEGLIIYHTGDEKTAVGTATVVSVDGFGDFASAAWGCGHDTALSLDGRVLFPHSLGIF